MVNKRKIDVNKFFLDSNYRKREENNQELYDLTKPMINRCIKELKRTKNHSDLEKNVNICSNLIYYGDISKKLHNIKNSPYIEDYESGCYRIASPTTGQFKACEWDSDHRITISYHNLEYNKNTNPEELINDINLNIVQLEFIRDVLYPKNSKKKIL